MSAFEEMFYRAYDHAQFQGRRPVAALFGPEEYAALRGTAQYMMAQSTEAWMKGEPLKIDGLPVGRMQAPGVAVVTRRPGHFVKFQVAGKG